MNDLARQKLCELINQYGVSLCNDPQRFKSLLKDRCAQYPLELNALVNALNERVPAALMSWRNTVPKDVLIGQITNWLEVNLGLAEDAARWAVESWALALGVISSDSSVAPGPPTVDPKYRLEVVGRRQPSTPSSPLEVEPSPHPVQPTPPHPSQPPSSSKLPLLIGLNVAAVGILVFIALNNSSTPNPSSPQPTASPQTPFSTPNPSSPQTTFKPQPIASPLQPEQCRVILPTVGKSVRVFSQPSRGTFTGTRLPKDTRVTFIGDTSEFVKFESDKSQGWVFNDQIHPCSPLEQSGVISPTIGEKVRVFSQPSRNADIGKRIAKDTRVSLLGEKNEFVNIELQDKSLGWVFNDQIHPLNHPEHCDTISLVPMVRKTARVFSQPSRNTFTGKRLSKDTKVSLLGEKNEFVNIELPDKSQGWVFNDQINSYKNQGWFFNDQINPCNPLKQCGVLSPTVGDKVRVFNQPSRNAFTGTKIPKDTKVSLIGQKSEFVRIELQDKSQGWIFNDQIRPCPHP